VVTGLGAVTPIGNDHPTFWRNAVAGASGGGPITTFDASDLDTRIAAEVKDFDPSVAMNPKMARRMSRFIHFGMAAGKEAIEDAGLDFTDWTPEQRDRVAVAVNTSGGGMEQVIIGEEVIAAKGPRFVSPFAIPALSGSMAACLLSMEYGLTGPVITQVAACASSVICFLDGLRMIQRGEVDVVITGGAEAPLLRMGFAALSNMGALSQRNDDPERASRPFDRDRDGFLFGEGAGVIVLESAEHAMKRGADIHAEVVGAALSADAFHISAPEPTGRGAAMAMTKALRDASVAPDEGALPPARARRPRRPRRGRLHRGPRHLHAAQRRDRDARHQDDPRRPCLQDRRVLAQVDGRAPAGRGRRGGGTDRHRRHP
jgi:3-oxoacyl-[acyl-carrier-protein] synthase II